MVSLKDNNLTTLEYQLSDQKSLHLKFHHYFYNLGISIR